MRTIIVGKNDAGQRLDRFLLKALPALSPGECAKYLRTKFIKLNRKKASGSDRIEIGDEIEFFIHDRYFVTVKDEAAYKTVGKFPDILYEDENILLLVKEPGLSVHEDESDNPDTLINRVKYYCSSKGYWEPENENSFVPALCNRIDRNTGGIVIAAKNAAALREMNHLIHDRAIDKYYLAIAHGMLPQSGKIHGYLQKLPDEKRVIVRSTPFPGAKTAITEYKTIALSEKISLCECHLITGRTHQIRAQMAFIGHPLLGDGKYGKPDPHQKYQALFSYKLVFSFQEDAGILNNLRGKTFTVKHIDFLERYFPSVKIK